MLLLVLNLVLVIFAYAAPSTAPPSNRSPCVDGVNNVIHISDTDDASKTIHVHDVIAQTYDAYGNPSCSGGSPAVSFPGHIRLVRGTIVVDALNPDLKEAEVDLTLKKKSIIIGWICYDGVAKKRQVPEEFCHHSIYPYIGDALLQMLSTPGTYDLEKMEKEAHCSSVIQLPTLSKKFNKIVKGRWRAELALTLNGRKLAHIKAPSTTTWLYFN
ncbi:Parasitic stage specific protein 1 [Trichostrongylus colubriformis]|uniref:Parasitic stage specific protein 1 n=1 Tax=Trichostrongylus colubriformis TaxID=6319 RepID=A0AAN8F538_TRICO